MRQVLAFLLFFIFSSSHLLAAELWLRESLVKKHAQDILVAIKAMPDKIGKRAHPIKEDCDLHVPLRSDDIRVPILGEIKNACSQPEAEVTPTYWPKKLTSLEGQTVQAEGVLRVWLEHPPTGDEKQCECYKLPLYVNSNPDHMVELHPLTRLGNISFVQQTALIREGAMPYFGYRVEKLSSLEKKKISVRRVNQQGEMYIAIKGSKTGFNHWTLPVTVTGQSEKRKDGHAFEVMVKDGNVVVKKRLRALTIKGTPADTKVQSLQVNDETVLFGLVRLDLSEIENEAGPKWKSILMPYEMVVLDILK